ncbi:uncharacterized protein LOC126738675 [Anthonomus grandis grandis]|uniref:uncharacterized protein LOC126738675 n=1 Tax=Anthonomus grandis grandis TaxID=2921223 RepID=UPI002164FC12|nr:uncharacterized protein LOC126738675 [Anthonomus grandis grandis]
MEKAPQQNIPGNKDDGSEAKLDEDVPEDFFDDFMKEDFMAGLDIVDEDNNIGLDTDNSKQPKVQKQKNRSKIDHVKKFRDSPPGVKTLVKAKGEQKKSRADSQLKRLDKALDNIKKAPLKKPDKHIIDAEIFDIRRDPEKTRMAIERDKVKSAKDKEKRLITDIVETGLVPPGMELEMNFEEVSHFDSKPVIGDLREKIRARKSRSKPPVDKRSVRKSLSPGKPRRVRTPKLRSPGFVSAATSYRSRNRSPIRRSFNLSRSPIRRIERSPYRPSFRRSRSFRMNCRSPSPRRRIRSRSRRSPFSRHSRSRDRSSSYHRRRDSYSPRRRSRSRSPRKVNKNDKPSFLEELVAKLQETRPLYQSGYPPHPSVVPSGFQPVPYLQPSVMPQSIPPLVQPGPPSNSFFVPQTLPAPQPQYQQPQPKCDPYDESFFIGTTTTSKTVSKTTTISENPPGPDTLVKNGISSNPRFEGKDITKLFGDKRIKLSDFLAISSKPTKAINSSSPKVQEKVKVIQRCQDAIKLLNQKRFTGPLIVQRTDTHECSKDKTISPMLRKPIIRLPFTTPGMTNSSEINFTKCCEMLLRRVGIDKNSSELKKPDKLPETSSKQIVKTEAPPTAIASSPSEPKSPIKTLSKSISIQTDKELSICKDCLKRKGILYSNCGVQSGNPMLTFSVSTQVTEADFYSMIPKTQSLASLTPAQLLGKQSISDFTKMSSGSFESRHGRNMTAQEVLTRARQTVPSPPAPPFMHTTPASLQTESYPQSLLNTASLASLMALRAPGAGNSFMGDRKGGFPKRY